MQKINLNCEFVIVSILKVEYSRIDLFVRSGISDSINALVTWIFQSHNGAQIEFAVVVKVINRETPKIREHILIIPATHQNNVIRSLDKIPMIKFNSKRLQCKENPVSYVQLLSLERQHDNTQTWPICNRSSFAAKGFTDFTYETA